MSEQCDPREMAKRWAQLKKEGRVPPLADVLRSIQTRLKLTASDRKLLKGMKISVDVTPVQLELFTEPEILECRQIFL